MIYSHKVESLSLDRSNKLVYTHMQPTTTPMIILSGSVVPLNKNVEHIKDKFSF